jgi:hypothetical protein
VREDAALEQGVELGVAGRAGPKARRLARHKQFRGLFVSWFGFDELRLLTAGARLGVGDEARRVLLHQAVQRGLLGAVALVAERERQLLATSSGHEMSPMGRYRKFRPKRSSQRRGAEDLAQGVRPLRWPRVKG